MNMDNIKMFARYALAIAVSFAAGKGYISGEQADLVSNFLKEAGAVIFAFAPALYAAFKVNNKPVT
jgi:hypothetical protein